jgi:hypothetical protein
MATSFLFLYLICTRQINLILYTNLLIFTIESLNLITGLNEMWQLTLNLVRRTTVWSPATAIERGLKPPNIRTGFRIKLNWWWKNLCMMQILVYHIKLDNNPSKAYGLPTNYFIHWKTYSWVHNIMLPQHKYFIHEPLISKTTN